jgi:hypothetical protein
MMSCLAVAAVAGVAYGLNLVITLVEHWAVFQIGVAQTLQ